MQPSVTLCSLSCSFKCIMLDESCRTNKWNKQPLTALNVSTFKFTTCITVSMISEGDNHITKKTINNHRKITYSYNTAEELSDLHFVSCVKGKTICTSFQSSSSSHSSIKHQQKAQRHRDLLSHDLCTENAKHYTCCKIKDCVNG